MTILKSSQFSIVVLLAIAIFVSLVSGTPVAAPAPAQSQLPPGQNLTWETAGDYPGEIVCETDRTSDYYGLGVRLGNYMAWLTGWIANVAIQDEIAGAMDTNAIFLFAFTVAIVRCTITNLVSRIDGLMLMQLSTGTMLSCISVWGYRTCVYKNEGPQGIRNFGGFGTHLRVMLCMAVSTYGFWFWMWGANGSLETGEAPCDQVYTWFFTKLHVHNSGIRVAYLTLFIILMIYYGVMACISISGPITRIAKMHFLVKYRFFRTSSRLRYATGLNYGQLKLIFHVLSIFNLFWIIFTIIICEFTLNENHIASVLGENGRIFFPSQLIPFAIGTASLLRVMYIYFETYRSVDHSPSLGRSPTVPRRQLTRPKGKGWLKMLAPATRPAEGTVPAKVSEEEAKKMIFEDEDMDEEMEGQTLQWRLLVTYLPWLHAIVSWRRLHRDAKLESPGIRQNVEGAQLVKAERLDVERVQKQIETEEETTQGEDKRRETWGSENTLRMHPTNSIQDVHGGDNST